MSSSEPRFFFIVGCGRSGTTMLQQALNRHSQVAIPPETGFFIDLLGHTARGQRHHLARINADLGIDLAPPPGRLRSPDSARRYYGRLAAAYADTLDRKITHFGEKSPRHLLVLPRIQEVLPEARVLLIYRDGRDVALSLSEVPWGPRNLYVNFAIWLRFRRWHDWAMRESRLEVMPIRYEDLVRDPEGGLREATDFLDLPPETLTDPAGDTSAGIPEWEMGWKARALEPITTARVGRWRQQLSDEQRRRLEGWGGEALSSLGYELSGGDTLPAGWWFRTRVQWKLMLWRARRTGPLLAKNLFRS
jgi:hypothetical protein